jgi:hypothetical protein
MDSCLGDALWQYVVAKPKVERVHVHPMLKEHCCPRMLNASLEQGPGQVLFC